MAHSLSAQKRIRQNAKNAARNRWRMKTLREAAKEFNEKMLHGSVDEAKASYKKLSRLYDRCATKGIVHKNHASRHKSRLSARLKAKSAKGK
ncbi:MAG: 30S ribosomal protein S20 [Phycisphaeraceae bacterium]|nr:30S ribosomal protein S20 [Phycisphaeraceae bacterium]